MNNFHSTREKIRSFMLKCSDYWVTMEISGREMRWFSNYDICEWKTLFRCPVRMKYGILLRENDLLPFGEFTLTEYVHCFPEKKYYKIICTKFLMSVVCARKLNVPASHGILSAFRLGCTLWVQNCWHLIRIIRTSSFKSLFCVTTPVITISVAELQSSNSQDK